MTLVWPLLTDIWPRFKVWLQCGGVTLGLESRRRPKQTDTVIPPLELKDMVQVSNRKFIGNDTFADHMTPQIFSRVTIHLRHRVDTIIMTCIQKEIPNCVRLIQVNNRNWVCYDSIWFFSLYKWRNRVCWWADNGGQLRLWLWTRTSTKMCFGSRQ